MDRSRIAGTDRRRLQRVTFDPPLVGQAGDTSLLVSNLSLIGMLVEHDNPLATGTHVTLSFGWYEPIELETRVVRSEEIAGRFRSTLEILHPSGPLVRSVALRMSLTRIARLESLVEASKLVNSTIEPEALVESILTVARTQLGVDRTGVYFVDHRRQEIWTEESRAGESHVIRFPLGTGLAGHVAQTGEAIVLVDAYADPRFDPAVDLGSGIGKGSMLCVPVRDREQNVVGVLQLLHESPRFFEGADLGFLQAISEHIAIAMRNAEFVHDGIEKNRMDTELSLGRDIQARLLPQPPEDWGGVDVAASSVPCFEVGGDCHDFIELPDGGLGLAIGDVSGKGVAAALIMSSIQAALRIAAPTEPDLALLIARLDALLVRTTPRTKFATFFFGSYSRESRLLRYVNAGHNPPLVRTGGTLVRLEATGPPLGIMKGSHFREARIRLEAGSTLFLYTDGFTEAVSPLGEEFGTVRWEKLIREAAGRSSAELSQFLTAAITQYEGGAPTADDKTLVVFASR